MTTPTRTILHLDMDAFYASVEIRDDPSIAGKPVVVGGDRVRGVVLTCSYEARKFGVRSAMSMVEALRRCPQATVVPPRMEAYQEASRVIFRCMRRATPLVEGLSLDEAFLDVTDSLALHGDGPTIAEKLKRSIRARTSGLTASVGVATNKFVAKVASDLRKPDGLVVCEAGKEAEFLEPLALERLWGVGPKTAATMHASGWKTIGDLQRASLEKLIDRLGVRGAMHLQALAFGRDARPVQPGRAPKSVGSEGTFDHDLVGEDALAEPLLRHCEEIARRMRDGTLCARALVLKIKLADHSLVTRRATADRPMVEAGQVFALARALLSKLDVSTQRVRLIGVSAIDLGPLDPPQQELFAQPVDDRAHRLGDTIDALEERFGARIVRRAGA
ncbi:MAG: DNA polymerase IV [Polyangiales bacterium]